MKQIGQKGFSLVELLVTIGIIAVVAAIAIPQLQRYATNSRLKSAARDIMGDVFLYKERAIAENRQYRITFNIANNTYSIEQLPGTVMLNKGPSTFGGDIRLDNANTTET
ncbi:MAG TPA: prepilin-type N-terminal cleavage/methylation domain-containing protein, partial [Nitrospirae bacterium]|nr:prepilin-type N-terminal cleavage/methylation domain-containing protein [Nitrospirota bacterium]